MNPKKVINKHKFQRIFMKKGSWWCHAHYSTCNPDNWFESEEPVAAVWNGDFLYIQRFSKETDDEGFPMCEYYRYSVKEGEPRADKIAFYKYSKVW